MDNLVTITETFVRVGEKTFMESSLRPGEWREVPVVWLDQITYPWSEPRPEPKVEWLKRERLMGTKEHRLLTA